MSQEEKVIINIETKPAQESLKELRKTINDSKSAMADAEEGTQEWVDALAKASDAQIKLNDINRIVRGSALDLGAALQNGTRILNGMVGGINAVRGVTAMFGADNEKLMETLVKLQAGMAIIQGIDGIDGMINGFRNLSNMLRSTSMGIKVLTVIQRIWNAVTAANPIFILVAVLAAVTTGIITLTKVLGKNNNEQERGNELLKEEFKLRQNLSDIYDHEINKMREMGATEYEIFKTRINNLLYQLNLAKQNEKRYENEYNNIKKNKKAEQDAIDEAESKYKKSMETRMNLEKQRLKLIEEIEIWGIKQRRLKSENDKKELELEEERLQKLRELREQELKEIQDIQYQLYLDTLSDRDRDINLLELEYNKRKVLFEKYNIELVHLEEWKMREIKKINDRYLEDENDIIDEREEMAWELASEIYQIYHQSTMSELELLTQRYEDEKRLLEEFGIDTTKLTELYEKDKTKIIEDENKLRLQSQISYFNEALIGAQNLTNSLSAISNMRMEQDIKAAGDNEERKEQIRKESFERNKKFEIANTIMSGLNGVVNALSAKSVIPDPTGSILKAANAALIGVTTAANVSAIRSTTYESAMTGMFNSSQSPNFSNSIPPQLSDSITPVRTIETENEIELQKTPIKAYVVDSEIEAKRKINNNIKNEADF